VGDLYRWGDGVEQNSEKAAGFLKAAADQGHPQAAFDLSLILNPAGNAAPEAMQSLTKDAQESKRYLDIAVIRFRQLADAGDVESMARLGLLFHWGWGVEMDGAQAARWLIKAFDADDVGSANNLSLVYYEGDIRVRDKAKSYFWYLKTKAHGCQCIGIEEFETEERRDGDADILGIQRRPLGGTISAWLTGQTAIDRASIAMQRHPSVRAKSACRWPTSEVRPCGVRRRLQVRMTWLLHVSVCLRPMSSRGVRCGRERLKPIFLQHGRHPEQWAA
jgi:hypothetical protein